MGNRSSSSAAAANDPKVLEFIDSKIAEDKIVVFSKTYCGFCTRAKDILNSTKAAYEVIELDRPIQTSSNDDASIDGSAIQAALAARTGQRTVPSVWIGTTFIGGCSEVEDLHYSDQLIPKLQAIVDK